jgi:hypothetical protein
MKADSNKDTQLSLRVDETLRRQLADAAKRSVRSLNGEIVYRLRSTFEQPSDAPPGLAP